MKGSDRRNVSSHLWLTVHLQCICSGCPMVSTVLRICGVIRAFFIRFVLNLHGCFLSADIFGRVRALGFVEHDLQILWQRGKNPPDFSAVS